MNEARNLFPNPGKELRSVRKILSREKEVIKQIENLELVLLVNTSKNQIYCNCESYNLLMPDGKHLPSHQGVSSAVLRNKNADKLKVHDKLCRAVLHQEEIYQNNKDKSPSSGTHGSGSIKSLLSMGHSIKSESSEEEHEDLSQFVDPLRCNHGSFLIYKLDFLLNHEHKPMFVSIVEFLRRNDSGTPSRTFELCVTPSGKIINVEQSVIDGFYRMVWAFVNDPQARVCLEKIHKNEITPYQLASRYGQQLCFRNGLKNATWRHFERVLPDWPFPMIEESRIVQKWFYTIPSTYGQGKAYSKLSPIFNRRKRVAFE